jgi:hypothetical protein
VAKFTASIDLGNAAFDGADGTAEIARILRKLAGDVEYMGFPVMDIRLFDINGNAVGVAKSTGRKG